MRAVIKAKGSCCKDKPRCKRCPVVLKRLANAGLAERVGGRHYELTTPLSKKQLKPYR
jgi:hypothetical protein